jgi:hypothetical protein
VKALVCFGCLVTAVAQLQRTPTPSLAELECRDRTDGFARARTTRSEKSPDAKESKIGDVDQVHLASSARMKYALATS